mmetsp:Transcript_27324/g.27705  ORF Transcript_27324/g.27705 Transcript_27324/m.27705 type:complete len:130 (-) Transcript_27324:141-530(-)
MLCWVFNCIHNIYEKIRLSASAFTISSIKTWKSAQVIALRSSSVHFPSFSPLITYLSKIRMAEFILARSMALMTLRYGTADSKPSLRRILSSREVWQFEKRAFSQEQDHQVLCLTYLTSLKHEVINGTG